MSAIPAVTAALYQTLTDEITGPQVVFGVGSAPELVAIFNTEFKREYRLIGPVPAPQDERFQIQMLIEVLNPSGRDMEPAVARAWEIFEDVDTAVRGDHTLDGLSWNALIETGNQEFFQTDQQQGCRIRFVLAGTARI